MARWRSWGTYGDIFDGWATLPISGMRRSIQVPDKFQSTSTSIVGSSMRNMDFDDGMEQNKVLSPSNMGSRASETVRSQPDTSQQHNGRSLQTLHTMSSASILGKHRM